jgi:hypothetical protein
MTNKQESVEKMSLSSVSFLNANAAITGTIPGYSTYFTNYCNYQQPKFKLLKYSKRMMKVVILLPKIK